MAANQEERNFPLQEGRPEVFQPRIVRDSPEKQRERAAKRDHIRGQGRTLLYIGGFFLVYAGGIGGAFADSERRWGQGGHPLMTAYTLMAGTAGVVLFILGLIRNRSRV